MKFNKYLLIFFIFFRSPAATAQQDVDSFPKPLADRVVNSYLRSLPGEVKSSSDEFEEEREGKKHKPPAYKAKPAKLGEGVKRKVAFLRLFGQSGVFRDIENAMEPILNEYT